MITENLRIQRGGGDPIPYIDVSNALADIRAKQNHTVFARRGCGKTLLLHESSRKLDASTKSVYLNCEDFKHHSFPNVLIEILDALFGELEGHLVGWFGKSKAAKGLIVTIRQELSKLKETADTQEEAVKTKTSSERGERNEASIAIGNKAVEVRALEAASAKSREETERTFRTLSDKLHKLNNLLPQLKRHVRAFFDASSSTKAVFLQIDDLYHLRRADQPFVVDYIHRLCKDLPLYFKIATLRHASTLYVDREGQPVGAQERHDYQPINIDYTLSDFKRTREQNRQILHEFGRLAGLKAAEVDDLFRGEAFDRLVMAGGGVPRDTLSLFLEVLSTVHARGEERIGKDDVRTLSRSNLERRIGELKQDSEGGDQDILMRGIYALRSFCLERKTNVFVISEQALQQHDHIRNLINRLLDYRIIHNVGVAITHKSQPGTYQAFAIDIGCYAHLRKLDGRFNELDLSDTDVKEKMRSAPVMEYGAFNELWESAPQAVEAALLADPTDNN